jgi:hypothetical protein
MSRGYHYKGDIRFLTDRGIPVENMMTAWKWKHFLIIIGLITKHERGF